MAAPSFVQAESTGQEPLAQSQVQFQFNADVAEGDVLVVIAAWESSGSDPTDFFDDLGNDYIAQPIQRSGGHASQVFVCLSAKAGFPTLQMDFPGPTGDNPSITAAEYGPGILTGSILMATGSGGTADAGPIPVTQAPAIVIALADTTQNSFSASAPFTLRTNNGHSAPMRSAIADATFVANGSYNAPISFGTAPWEASALVLFSPTAVPTSVKGSGSIVQGSGSITAAPNQGSGAITPVTGAGETE